MEMELLWTAALTALLSLLGWAYRNLFGEVQRLQVLVNKTREEIARDYVTREEANSDLSRIINRLEALDAVSYTHLTLPTICSV